MTGNLIIFRFFFTINRTIFGIETRKPIPLINPILYLSIEPFLELKLGPVRVISSPLRSINRTIFGIETSVNYPCKVSFFKLSIEPFLELKPLFAICQGIAGKLSIEPFLELKLGPVRVISSPLRSINRTIFGIETL